MAETDPSARASQETMVDFGSRVGPVEAGPELDPGEQVGRYMILHKLGAGGMGVVYAAYDPDLDRKVAIKLLHAGLDGAQSSTDGRALLLREAQAMAKLSHVNVVAVHDVGLAAGQMFLAMEFVAGRTLREWLSAGPRTNGEILEVYIRAGLGLSAAHQAGLIHRDFKPENVLLSDAGVVKVTDFGLARRGEQLARTAPTPALVGQDLVSGETLLSGTMGTPAYMAPEQHMGLPIGAATDQFSFCVALWEALYGRRPFAGTNATRLLVNMMDGKFRDPPPGSTVPGRVRSVLIRGLAIDADSRWPTMGELLGQLQRDPVAARKRTLTIVLGAAAVVALVVGVQANTDNPTPVCANMDRHLAGVWDDATRDAVREALTDSGVGFAETTWARVEPALDSYTGAWVAMRTDACEATQVRGEQSQELLDLRMGCLDERLRKVEGLVAVLRDADATVAQNAIVAVASLPSLDRCADPAALRARFPLPDDPAAVTRIAELDAKLARAEASEKAGKYTEGLELAREVTEASAELEFPPLHTRALRYFGSLTGKTGDEAAAEQLLRQAFFQAVRWDLDDLASGTASELLASIGDRQAKPDLGRPWADHAFAYATAEGSELLRASVLYNLGAVALRESKFDEAKQLADQALEIRQRLLGEQHEAVLASINQLGLIASDVGKFDEARLHFTRGLALGKQVLGEDHPDLARFINNVAKIDWQEGDFPAAKAAFEQALALQEAAFGPAHRNVAQLHNNLAAVAVSTNNLDEAQRRFELALAIWEQVLGPEHPQVADALNNLAVVAASRRDDEGAREFDERALAIRERTMEPDHPDLAKAYHNLGEDIRRLGRPDEARLLHEKALAMWEKKLAPDHDSIAGGLTTLAHDLIDLGRPAEALLLLVRAKAIRDVAEVPPSDHAITDYLLARALWEVPGPQRDRPRALELADSARILMLEDMADGRELEELDAWLATVRGRDAR